MFYPSVHFECRYCQEIWVIQCRIGYKCKGLHSTCWEEERALTTHSLVVDTNLGVLELDSPEWYRLLKKGVRGKLDSKGQALAIECQQSNKVPYNADTVKLSRWVYTFKRRYETCSTCGSPEDYPCCHKDGLPRRWWRPCRRRQRQRSTPVGNSDGSESNDEQDGQSAPRELPQC